MNSLAVPPRPFWQTGPDPSASEWTSWKTSFSDYLFLLETFHSSEKVSGVVKLKLLRQHLGDEGQKVFDCQNLNAATYDDAITVLDKSWAARTNVFLGRYRFCQLRQENGESLEKFLKRLRSEIRSCEYSSIPAKRFEETALLQQLITGVADGRIRENLLLEDAQRLTWERACDTARSLNNVRGQLQSLTETKSTHLVSILSKLKVGSPTCFRCGSERHHANYPQCLARTVCCNACGKTGHYARCCKSK